MVRLLVAAWFNGRSFFIRLFASIDFFNPAAKFASFGFQNAQKKGSEDTDIALQGGEKHCYVDCFRKVIGAIVKTDYQGQNFQSSTYQIYAYAYIETANLKTFGAFALQPDESITLPRLQSNL
jgi:hypothetical protein